MEKVSLSCKDFKQHTSLNELEASASSSPAAASFAWGPKEHYNLPFLLTTCHSHGESLHQDLNNTVAQSLRSYSESPTLTAAYSPSCYSQTTGARRRKSFTETLSTDGSCNKRAPTFCYVCGEPTKCCHYDVPSCNGCKTFFRRCVLSSFAGSAMCMRRYKCRLQGHCEIFGGKSHCRACRLDRCILMGMNPKNMQLPLSFKEEDLGDLVVALKKRRRELINALRQEWWSCRVKNELRYLNFEESGQEGSLQSLLYTEEKVKWLRESTFCESLSEGFYSLTLNDVIDSNESILAKAGEFHKHLDWPRSWEALAADLAENGLFFADPSGSSEMKPLKSRMTHFYSPDLFLSLELLKTLNFFQQLDRQDKECLVKHVLLANTISMEAFYSCKMHSTETLMSPDGMMPALLGKYVVKRKDIDPADLQFIYRLGNSAFSHSLIPFQRVTLSMEEFALLRAIIFCHFPTPNLSKKGRELLEVECGRYSKILLRRLQAVLGDGEGAKKYAEILALTDTLFHSAKLVREFQIYRENILGFYPFLAPPFFHTLIYY